MSEPIKIVVVAETQQAAAELQKFVQQQSNGLSSNLAKTAKEAENLGKHLGNARIGLMELEHTARASTDILLMGGNPRMLLAQIPQVIQSLTLMGVSLSTLLPWVAAVGAAVGAGYLGWREYMSGVNDATDEVNQMSSALEKLPALLERIQGLTHAGLISSAAGTEFADYLGKNPKKPLYRHADGTISPIATETVMAFPHTGDPFQDQKAQEVTRQAQRATVAEAQKYVEEQLAATQAQQKATLAYREAITKANEEIATGLDREITQIQDKYAKEIDDLRVKFEAAFKMGLIGPNEQKVALEKIDQLQAAEAAAVAQARQKYAAAQARKDQETLAQWQQTQKQMVASQEKALEDAILAQREQTKDKSIPLFQQEFDARTELYRRELDQGIITEDQLVEKVQAAQAKRLAGEKAFQAELQRTAQFEIESRRTNAELQLHKIQTNPFLTEQEKAAASVGPIGSVIGANAQSVASYQRIATTTNDEAAREQALTKINELTKEQIDLQNQLEIAIKQSGDIQSRWTLSWQQQLIQLENQWKDLATSLAHGAFQTIVQGVQAMADALTNVIMGTQRAGAAFAQFATTALTSFIEMVLETIIYAKLAIPILTALGVLSSGATAAGGSAVTIASLGAAMSFVGGIVGFAGGGLVTGPGTGSSDSIPARLSNGEYVFSAPAVQRIGVSNLEVLHHGGSLQNSTSQNIKATAHVIVVNDRNEMLNALQSSAAEEIVVAHVRKNRLKIGIQT